MKVNKSSMVVLLSATMLIIGCGKQRSAHDLVESFLDSCLVDNNISELTFSSLDSTRHINDSVITAIRSDISKTNAFKKNVKYGKHNTSQSLHYITATYKKSNGEKAKQTFYIDKEHTSVICVKNDYVAN